MDKRKIKNNVEVGFDINAPLELNHPIKVLYYGHDIIKDGNLITGVKVNTKNKTCTIKYIKCRDFIAIPIIKNDNVVYKSKTFKYSTFEHHIEDKNNFYCITLDPGYE